MGTLVFQANLGGAVNLIGPNTASTVNFTLPSADGTSGQALVTNGSGTLSFSTFTSGAAGSNTQVQFNSSGAFAGSANLTFDGTTLTAAGLSGPHNGTVGATTPNTGAFTTLTASSSVTLSGGTANGVVYLNGSKVVTTGSALTFDGTSLGVKAATTEATNVNIGGGRSGNGFAYLDLIGDAAQAASYSARFIRGNGGANATTSLIHKGTGAFEFTASDAGYLTYNINGSEQMRLTSTGLGIGASSPTQKLDVAGSGATRIVVRDTASTGIARLLASGADAYVGNASATGNLVIQTNLNNIATFDVSGNLGLGVTPSAWSGVGSALQIGVSAAIIGNSASSSSFISNAYYDGSAYRHIGAGYAARLALTSGAYSFQTSTTSGSAGGVVTFTAGMTLDASGNLGIGTTSPGVILDVQSASPIVKATATTGTNPATFRAVNTGGTSYFGRDSSVGGFSGTAYSTLVWGNGAYPMVFATNDVERARITSSGYFKASNTGTYQSSTATYHELYNDANSNTVRITNAKTSGFTDAVVQVSFNQYAPNDGTAVFLWCNDTSAVRTKILSNGGLANYSANDVNLSDRREKTNFAPAGNYLAKICAIPVQTFNYIDQSEDDPGLTLGVVAQDVQAVAPELVSESNWGTEEEPKMRLSIYQTDLQYALMKCIQEQQAIIEQLKADVAALKGN